MRREGERRRGRRACGAEAVLAVIVMVAVGWLGLPGCDGAGEPDGGPRAAGSGGGDHGHGHDEAHGPELAAYMGELQRHSQKLGFAIEGRSARLTAFYLHEIEEVIERIERDVPEHDGFAIDSLIRSLAVPAVEALEQRLEADDWPAAGAAYAAMIETCNACHTATEHEFIVILPAEGDPPFNQRFDVE